MISRFLTQVSISLLILTLYKFVSLFQVIWDSRLIPPKRVEPYDYPAAAETINKDINMDSMVKYFAHFNNGSLGKIDKLYWKWANRKGILSGECQELNELFSSAVDGQYIPVPEYLLDETIPVVPDKMVWERMLTIAEAKYKAYHSDLARKSRTNATAVYGLTEAALLAIVRSDDMALGDYELLVLCYKWWTRHKFQVGLTFSPFESYFISTNFIL